MKWIETYIKSIGHMEREVDYTTRVCKVNVEGRTDKGRLCLRLLLHIIA